MVVHQPEILTHNRHGTGGKGAVRARQSPRQHLVAIAAAVFFFKLVW
jgi:hypothetical protein